MSDNEGFTFYNRASLYEKDTIAKDENYINDGLYVNIDFVNGNPIYIFNNYIYYNKRIEKIDDYNQCYKCEITYVTKNLKNIYHNMFLCESVETSEYYLTDFLKIKI